MKLSILRKSLLIVTMTCLFLSETQAQVCRVSTSGTPLGSGTSWNDTKLLQWALFDDLNCTEIWVKSGTYYPTSGLNRDISFNVYRGTSLYGGFYGNETSREQRDPINNKAILSGDIGLNNINNDNSRNILNINPGVAVLQYRDAITEIDGFVIRDGYNELEHGNGAGLYCYTTDTARGCSPDLSNVEFINNVADNGGAIYIYTGGDSFSDILISRTRFINNQAHSGSGGAVYISVNYGLSVDAPDDLNINNSEFINNQAQERGGAISVFQDITVSTVPPLIEYTTFAWNSANKGGAIYSEISNNSTTPVRIRNSTFNNNTSTNSGGAIYNTEGHLRFENSTITENTATISGGGIYTDGQDSSINLNNTILWENQSPSASQLKAIDNLEIVANYNVIQGDCANFEVNGSLSCSNNQTSDPMLGQLRYNHELTQTMIPESGSSAINNGDNSTCLAEDQRFFSRPQNVTCDIGSVEVRDACRVTTSGTNNGNGTNWGGEAMSLQTALAVSYCPLVKISAGTYKPTTSTDRTISFNIPEGVTIQGGYDGTIENENNPDPDVNKVILSGNIGIPEDNTDNSYHVVKLNGHIGSKILPSTIIKDFEIRDGYSSPGIFDFPNNSGAGMYCVGTGLDSECSPTIINVKFANNHAIGGVGGGLFNDADNDGVSSPQLIDVRFENNSASNGGAMYNNGSNRGHSSPQVVTGKFINNTATNSGGAIYNKGFMGQSNGTFLFGYFSLNSANYGGAVYNDGQDLGSSNPTFNQIEFFGNSAQFDGGAIYSAGWNSGQSKPYFLDVDFDQNSAQRGGAVFLNDLAGNETAEFNRVSFNQNQAIDGGALYNDGENGYSHPKLTNVTILNNVASNHGGGIYNNGEAGASSPTILNATFFNNSAVYGGAMFSRASNSGTSNAKMRHVIMWGNTASTDGPTVYHNLAESTTDDSIIQFGCPNYGAGNTNCNNIINNDPLFTTINFNDGHTTTIMLANNSPAIDAGDNAYCPSEDQRGRPRPNGSACDIGSVEVDFQGPTDIIFKNGFE